MNYLIDRSEQAVGTLILAHGAGAPMDSDFMNQLTKQLNHVGICVVRFEFSYMQQRRKEGGRRPPNRQPILMECWQQVYQDINKNYDVPKPLLIGGKSMGGRMASMIADELGADGVCCFGYPFQPPGKPEKLAERTEHLQIIKTPVLIFQGTRDPFGKPAELESMAFSPSLKIHWLDDGDHDLKPRKVSGLTQMQHFQQVAEYTAEFIQNL